MDPQNQQPPQQGQAIPPEIREFLEAMLQEAQLTTLDDQMKEGMVQELFYQLDNYLTSVIVDSMKPEDLEAFIKLNEERKPKEEIENFVREKVPNAEEIFTQAFVDFRNMYLDNVAKAKAGQTPPEQA
jgi:hypothetical protein